MFTIYILYKDRVEAFFQGTMSETRKKYDEIKEIFQTLGVAVQVYGPGKGRYYRECEHGHSRRYRDNPDRLVSWC